MGDDTIFQSFQPLKLTLRTQTTGSTEIVKTMTPLTDPQGGS